MKLSVQPFETPPASRLHTIGNIVVYTLLGYLTFTAVIGVIAVALGYSSQTHNLGLFAFETAAEMYFPIAAIWYWTRHPEWRALVRWRWQWKPMLLAVAGGVVLQLVLDTLISLHHFSFFTGNGSVEITGYSGGLGMALLTILVVVVAPACEETFFRGWLYPQLQSLTGKVWWPILLDGAIFATMHLEPASWVPLAITGVCLAWIWNRTRNIAVSASFHAGFNLVGAVAVIIAQLH